jgi:5,5'-dehydrodivanillate O-demethylase
MAEPTQTDPTQTEIAYPTLLRTGKGTLAGNYLRMFWQPVCDSASLRAGHVKPVRVMGEDITLYRGENGTAHAAANRCPHRGVRLALGFVDGDAIRCAYHGWTFDAEGQCIKQPAETRPFCDRIKIKTYPAQEYLGLVFVYLGEGEPPVLPRLGDFEDDDLYIREVAVEIWPCSYFDLLENTTDLTHTEFLHWHFGFKTPDRLEWRESEWGMSGVFGDPNAENAIYCHTQLHMPNSSEFTVTDRTGTSFYNRTWRVPVDDDHAYRFNVVALPRKPIEAAKAQSDANPFALIRGLSGEAMTRDPTENERVVRPVVDAAQALLAGEEDMLDLKERSAKMNHRYLSNIQDCAALSSLGPVAERDFSESFGRTDANVGLLRRIWLPELRALAEGRPLTPWRRPHILWEQVSAVHREKAKSFAPAE